MPIRTIEQGWILETRLTGYALGLNNEGRLIHCYWGVRLPYREDYPAALTSAGWASFSGPEHLNTEEYPGYGGLSYIDPCLKVTFGDGVRDVVLRLDTVEQSDDELHIHLRDAVYPLTVTLHYRVHAEEDLIERWVTVLNEGGTPLTIERVFSAQWHMPPGVDYRLTHVNGRWLDEMHLQRESLAPGIKILESRRLTTSHHHNPWFALDHGHANEDEGEVWFGVLAWSGNWKLATEVTEFASTRLSIGVNDWDFAWRLEAGQ